MTAIQASVQMERNYYWNLEYLDIQFFPVLAEDYELTTDRSSCEKEADDPYLEGQVGLGGLSNPTPDAVMCTVWQQSI